MNSINIVGNLTRDPELKQVTINGETTSVCRFSVAVNRNKKNANGESVADFFNVVAWRGLAETAAKYLAKGRKVGITGSVRTGSYEKDGVKHSTFEIEANNVEFLSPKGEAQQQTASAASAAPAPAPAGDGFTVVETDELPF